MLFIVADGIGSVLENPSESLVILLLLGGVILIALVAIVGAIWHQLRKSDIEGALKSEMIQRGMSVDEIERVLAAKMGPTKTPAVTMRFETKSSTPTDN